MTRSLYGKLCADPSNVIQTGLWNAKVPVKVRIFLWQLATGRLPTNDQLLIRHGPSNGQCALCQQGEDADHIFFKCALAEFVWSGLRDMFNTSWHPRCYPDLEQILGTFKGKRGRVLRVFAAVCWALWLIRNKYSTEAIFPKQPDDCIFKILILYSCGKRC